MADEEEPAPPEAEEVPAPPVGLLTQALIESGISQVSKTADGASYAYTKLVLPEKELTEISLLREFIRLRYLDFKKNQIVDLSPLTDLPHLLAIDFESNAVASLKTFTAGLDQPERLNPLMYLQWINLSDNKLTELPNINMPFLSTLNLNKNQIATVEAMDLTPKLSKLLLDENQVSSLVGLPPSLTELSMVGNQLKSLEGVGALVSLESLNLQGNQLKTLEGFSANHSALKALLLKGNQIKRLRKPGVQCLGVLGSLRTLECAENPVAEVEDYKVRCKRRIPTLTTLDGNAYEEDEIAKAKEPEDAAQIEPATPPPEPAEVPAEGGE